MWYNGREQTISLQLKATHNDSVIDSFKIVLHSSYYNTTFIKQFKNGIQPETDYEVLMWSSNNLGSSDVIKLTVNTKAFKFFVSPGTIFLNGDQAIANFNATDDKITHLSLQCCLELTGYCSVYDYYYDANGTAGQLTYDNLPSGDVNIFDFTVYGGYTYNGGNYYLTMVRGVRVSRKENTKGEFDAILWAPYLHGV